MMGKNIKRKANNSTKHSKNKIREHTQEKTFNEVVKQVWKKV